MLGARPPNSTNGGVASTPTEPKGNYNRRLIYVRPAGVPATVVGGAKEKAPKHYRREDIPKI